MDTQSYGKANSAPILRCCHQGCAESLLGYHYAKFLTFLLSHFNIMDPWNWHMSQYSFKRPKHLWPNLWYYISADFVGALKVLHLSYTQYHWLPSCKNADILLLIFELWTYEVTIELNVLCMICCFSNLTMVHFTCIEMSLKRMIWVQSKNFQIQTPENQLQTFNMFKW